MRDKKVSLGWSRITDQVYATIKSQEGRKLGDPINITPEFLGAMVEYLRHRGGLVSINERVEAGKDAGMVRRCIIIQIVKDVLVGSDPKEAQAGKDGGV